MGEAFIISAVRTPIGIGKPNGVLASFAPVDLAAAVMREAVTRAGIEPGQLNDVVWGCVTPVGDQGANIARLALLQAGFPVTLPGVTLSRMCGSSQQAVHFAAQAILAGDMDFVLAGGIEMMSNQPLGADYPPNWPANFPYKLVHQGTSAEMLAEKWQLGRDQLDDYAFQSHHRAAAAIQAGYFNSQILPLTTTGGQEIRQDEGVRLNPDRQKMAALKPVFKPDGVVTAGNASQISDGAAGLVLASALAVGRYNLAPLARLESRVVVGSDPVIMLDGPITATDLVLKRAGMTLSDIDVIEINEAFACVPLAWAKHFDTNLERVNPVGGAIAHGHPLGATGAILMTKLVYELARRNARYGLQTMCIGHGMATATILENL